MTLSEYIDTHIDLEPEYLVDLERDTNISLVNPRMCSGHLQGRLLKMLTRMISPNRALELGTYSGYSALCIAEGMPAGSTLHTIEIEDELEDFIRDHLEQAPAEVRDRIKLHIGDAKEEISRLGGEFDMIFIDADKREYEDYYQMLKPLLRKGGFMLADNTLWDGHIVEEERTDAQTLGIKRFNEIVAKDSEVEKVILPIRDGLTLIYKK